jgi:hypothetical protein
MEQMNTTRPRGPVRACRCRHDNANAMTFSLRACAKTATAVRLPALFSRINLFAAAPGRQGCRLHGAAVFGHPTGSFAMHIYTVLRLTSGPA